MKTITKPVELTNKSPMPFGKFKGKPLIDVPASYLLWWYNNGKFKNIPLKKYVKENMDVLKKEIKENKW